MPARSSWQIVARRDSLFSHVFWVLTSFHPASEKRPNLTEKARMTAKNSRLLEPVDTFVQRHIGPTDAEIQEMLTAIGLKSLDALVGAAVPDDIRLKRP